MEKSTTTRGIPSRPAPASQSKPSGATTSEDTIVFKPLSDGLGLNHFADGLPYSSSAMLKGRRTMHHFNFPAPRAASTAAPTSTTSPLRPEIEQLIAEEIQTAPAEIHNAGFFRRALAYAIDFSLTLAFYAGLLYTGFYLNGFDLEDLVRTQRAYQFIAPLVLLYAVVYAGYFLIQEITWRRTIGKAMLNMHIRSSSPFAVIWRLLCFFVAALPLGIGLLWYFFDHRHRCWHDVITDSEVVVG